MDEMGWDGGGGFSSPCAEINNVNQNIFKHVKTLPAITASVWTLQSDYQAIVCIPNIVLPGSYTSINKKTNA